IAGEARLRRSISWPSVKLEMVPPNAPTNGVPVWHCNHCSSGDYSHHSCKNRSCPTCHQGQTEPRCGARGRGARLPLFSVTVTVPRQLRGVARQSAPRSLLEGILPVREVGSCFSRAPPSARHCTTEPRSLLSGVAGAQTRFAPLSPSFAPRVTIVD